MPTGEHSPATPGIYHEEIGIRPPPRLGGLAANANEPRRTCVESAEVTVSRLFNALATLTITCSLSFEWVDSDIRAESRDVAMSADNRCKPLPYPR
jgi:hypothetical protein